MSWLNSLKALTGKLRVNTQHKSEIAPLYLSSYWGYPKVGNLADFRSLVVSQPEIYGRIMRVVNDTINGYEISCEDEALKERVEEYLVSNDFMNCLESAMFDRLISGDGYLEPVSRKQSEATEFADFALTNFKTKGYLSKKYDVANKSRAIIQGAIAARLFEPTELWWVDQRWIRKEVDKNGKVKSYIEQVSGGPVVARWLPGELINISNYKVTNEVYGFTPLSVAYADMTNLQTLKQFIANFFVNNGVPDYLVNIKNAAPNSDTVKAFRKEWADRRTANARGSMVVTGEVEINSLTSVRDMDFPNLIKYLGYTLDLLWGIPPQLHDSNSSATRSIDTFLAPYYTNIRKEQKKLEDMLNYQLFGLFGEKPGLVKIKFSNPYLRDAVRNTSWATTAYKDGAISLSEYRAAIGASEALPKDLKDNPYKKNIENNPNSTNNPFKGVTSNNQVNGDKSPDDESPAPKKKLIVTEGVEYIVTE